jgi:membrane protease YdiL (CAAX protease family)
MTNLDLAGKVRGQCGLALGRVSLPLRVSKADSDVVQDVSWRRVELSVWLLLAMLPSITWVYPWPHVIYSLMRGLIGSLAPDVVKVLIVDATSLLIIVLVMGREARGDLRRALRLPEVDGFLLAVAFPVGIVALISLAHWLSYLFQWAPHQSPNIGHQPINAYFPLHANRVMVFMAAALVEELIFRGALQPRFVSRYGVIRGLAVLSIVFAGWHISADFPDGFTLTSAVIVTRVALHLWELSACVLLPDGLQLRLDLFYRST